LNKADFIIKRSFDVMCSFSGLLLIWWVILLSWVIVRLTTGEPGFFIQTRVGKEGKLFNVIKLRTMKNSTTVHTTVTSVDDVRITKVGAFLRKTKLDELPQLINVLIGDMSLVGPRPDVPGFADKLSGDDRVMLSIRPGITGPATIFYRNEEELLALQEDPEKYNEEVIFPKKVELNKIYINEYSFFKDLFYIKQTILG
jgi:lipopolysaccharide/colanic/teichoic acid biosynthesis glycosyltransferase